LANTRDEALTEFDAARLEFEESIRRAPDAALRFKPPGEDYALGGLVVHVAQVLRKYARVLDTILAADWQACAEPKSEDTAEEATLIHEGFPGPQRVAVLEDMRASHSAFVDALRNTPEGAFARKAPVTYGGSREAYPTSPSDVLGWVQDHYKEHTQQVGDLIAAWSESTR
jgi:hypothetical protein